MRITVGFGKLVAGWTDWREACEGLCGMFEDVKWRCTSSETFSGMSHLLVLSKMYSLRSTYVSNSQRGRLSKAV